MAFENENDFEKENFVQQNIIEENNDRQEAEKSTVDLLKLHKNGKLKDEFLSLFLQTSSLTRQEAVEKLSLRDITLTEYVCLKWYMQKKEFSSKDLELLAKLFGMTFPKEDKLLVSASKEPPEYGIDFINSELKKAEYLESLRVDKDANALKDNTKE